MSHAKDDVPQQVDDIFSYMCSLAVAKCAKKSEKKKASCGGAAMRKRLLIKNFVAHMLDQEKQLSTKRDSSITRELRKQLKGKIPSIRDEEEEEDEEELVEEEDEEEDEELEQDEELQQDQLEMAPSEEEEPDVEEDEDEEEDGEEEEDEEEDEDEEVDVDVHQRVHGFGRVEDEEEEEDQCLPSHLDQRIDMASFDTVDLPDMELGAEPRRPQPHHHHPHHQQQHHHHPHHHHHHQQQQPHHHAHHPQPHFQLPPPAAYLGAYDLGGCDEMAPPTPDLDDCITTDCGFQLPAAYGAPPHPAAAHHHHAATPAPASAAPSWRDPDPDLYMLEGSARFYDDYHTVPARDYQLLGAEEMQAAHENLLYPAVCEQFMLAPPCCTGSISAGASAYAQHNAPPNPLPDNFMDDLSLADASTPATNINNNNNTSNACACNPNPAAPIINNNNNNNVLAFANCATVPAEAAAHFGSAADFMSGVMPTADPDADAKPDDPQTTAFVDLVNVCPPPAKINNCRLEAHLGESGASYRHCITDLDTNTTTVVETAKFDFEQRKRPALDAFADGLQLKRIKL